MSLSLSFADTNDVLLFKAMLESACWRSGWGQAPRYVEELFEFPKMNVCLQFLTSTEQLLRNIPCIIVLLEVYF